jgi:hypothetical protein
VFKKKDPSDGLLSPAVPEQDHEIETPPEPRYHRRRFSTPESRSVYPSYDPYLATLPEEPQTRRPLSVQSLSGQLPVRGLNTNGDEDL